MLHSTSCSRQAITHARGLCNIIQSCSIINNDLDSMLFYPVLALILTTLSNKDKNGSVLKLSICGHIIQSNHFIFLSLHFTHYLFRTYSKKDLWPLINIMDLGLFCPLILTQKILKRIDSYKKVKWRFGNLKSTCTPY